MVEHTKTCLTACALVLVSGGRLDLDRLHARPPLHAAVAASAHQRIELLHRASDYDPALDHHDDPWLDEILLAQVDSVPLLFKPGQGWTYSNTGYFLARG